MGSARKKCWNPPVEAESISLLSYYITDYSLPLYKTSKWRNSFCTQPKYKTDAVFWIKIPLFHIMDLHLGVFDNIIYLYETLCPSVLLRAGQRTVTQKLKIQMNFEHKGNKHEPSMQVKAFICNHVKYVPLMLL